MAEDAVMESGVDGGDGAGAQGLRVAVDAIAPLTEEELVCCQKLLERSVRGSCIPPPRRG